MSVDWIADSGVVNLNLKRILTRSITVLSVVLVWVLAARYIEQVTRFVYLLIGVACAVIIVIALVVTVTKRLKGSA